MFSDMCLLVMMRADLGFYRHDGDALLSNNVPPEEYISVHDARPYYEVSRFWTYCRSLPQHREAEHLRT